MGNHQYLCTITTINTNTPLQYTTSVYPTQIVLLTWQASNPCCPSGFRKSAHPPWHTPRLQYSECESSESQMRQERVSSITQTFRASSLFRSSSATFSLASLASFLHDVSQLQQQGNHHSAHTHSRKLQAGYTAHTHTHVSTLHQFFFVRPITVHISLILLLAHKNVYRMQRNIHSASCVTQACSFQVFLPHLHNVLNYQYCTYVECVSLHCPNSRTNVKCSVQFANRARNP